MTETETLKHECIKLMREHIGRMLKNSNVIEAGIRPGKVQEVERTLEIIVKSAKEVIKQCGKYPRPY